MLTRMLTNEYLLMLLILIAVLHAFVKVMLIMRYRQMNFFGQKLKRSFFYYDAGTIKQSMELRIKIYYKLSNKVNTAFYSLMMVHTFLYLGIKIISVLQQATPVVEMLTASR